MKRKLLRGFPGISLLFSLCLSLSLQAQISGKRTAAVDISRPYEVYDAHEKHYFREGNTVLTVKTKGDKVMIQRFDATSMDQLSANEFEDFQRGYSLEEVKKFANKLYLFYSVWDKENEAEQLFAREIDIASAKFKDEGKRLLKVEHKITGNLGTGVPGPMGAWAWGSFGAKNKFNFYCSNDSSKILVKYRLKPEHRSDDISYDKIGLHVFNNSMTELWGGQIEMPYTEKRMNILDYGVDQKDNVYLLTTVFDDNTTKERDEDGTANYHIELLRVLAKSSSILSTTLNVEDKFIKNIRIFNSPDNKIICGGFYSDGVNRNNTNGIFSFKVDAEGKLSDLRSYEIPVEILNEYAKISEQKRNKKREDRDRADFANLTLREMQVLPDAGIVLVGEEYEVITYTTYDPRTGRTNTTYRYLYGDILIAKANSKGVVEWMRKLPKAQLGTQGRGNMSLKYFYDKVSNSNYMIFLDNIKNLNMGLADVPVLHRDGAGGYVTAYKIANTDGEVEKISIGDMRDFHGTELFQFTVDRILPLGNNKMLFESYKKDKEDVLIKVDFGKEDDGKLFEKSSKAKTEKPEKVVKTKEKKEAETDDTKGTDEAPEEDLDSKEKDSDGSEK